MRSNFFWTLAGYVVYAACQWGMLVALAKLGTAEMVGQFALGLAITAPVLMFTNLQLRSVLATDTRREYSFPEYLGLRLLASLLALTVVFGLSQSPAVLLVGVSKVIESISDVHYGRLQQHERMQPIARSLIGKGVLSLAAFWLAVYMTRNLLWALTGLIAAWTLVLVFYDIPRSTHGPVRPCFHRGTLTALAWRSLPLGVMSMLVSLNANIPRYFVEAQLGAAALGIFAALTYPMMAGTFVATALGQAALPVLARHFAAGQAVAGEFQALLLKVTAAGLLLGGTGVLISVLFGRQLLTLFYRPEYARHAAELSWLAVAAGMNYIATFLNAGVTATRNFRVLIVPYILHALLAAALSAVLIPVAGLIGAAWACCGIGAAGCVIPLLILARMRMAAPLLVLDNAA